MVKIIRYVATNDRGIRIGKFHQRCKHSDELIDRIRDMHEEQEIGYRRITAILIAEGISISRHTVRDICRYDKRAQTYEHWKKVEITVETVEDGALTEEPV